jgi:biopolymer transport protein ExbD
MRFYFRKKRQPPAVIIVALIDVLIVVMIFLMVTTTFKKPQPALRLALPESTQAIKEGADENPPLSVVVEADGTIRIGPDARPVTLAQLKTDLLGEAAKNPKLKLMLRADQKAPWGQIVKVMDVTKEAQIKNVSASVKTAGAP